MSDQVKRRRPIHVGSNSAGYRTIEIPEEDIPLLETLLNYGWFTIDQRSDTLGVDQLPPGSKRRIGTIYDKLMQ